MIDIFISSTFRDMNYERDVLNKEVEPKLKRLLFDYNKDLNIIDLRWGIDTAELSEKDANEAVLSVCFKEIDKCKPYIIVLLGDRYGYVPAGVDLPKFANNCVSNRTNISVTHMEIIHGVINNTESDNIFICFREADYSDMPEDLKKLYIEESGDSIKILDDLKAFLKERFQERCITYHSYWSKKEKKFISDDFEDLIYKKMMINLEEKVMSIRYKSPLHKYLSESDEMLRDNVMYVFKDDGKLKTHIDWIINSDTFFAVAATGGFGKSVYMSLLCSELKKSGYSAYILYCGNTEFASFSRNVAESILYILKVASCEEYDYEIYAQADYETLITEIINQRDAVKNKSFLFLDATDKCESSIMPLIHWCRMFLHQNIQIIFSSRKENLSNKDKANFTFIDLAYSKNDYKLMSKCILNKNSRSLDSSLINKTCRNIESPLQLSLLLMRLTDLNFEEIQQAENASLKIREVIDKKIQSTPNDIYEITSDYLEELFNRCKSSVFCATALSFLAFNEHGFTSENLRKLFRYRKKKWATLYYVDFEERFSFFIRHHENGKINISHDVVRQALQM